MSVSPGGVEVGRVSVRVLPDTSRLGTDLQVALTRLEARVALNIKAEIDTKALDADARAAVRQAKLAAGDLNIKAKVDKSQVSSLEFSLSRAATKADTLVGSLGAVGAAAILLTPALIPLIAAVGALGAALIAPIAIVGAGLTIGGIFAGFAVSETQKQLKVIGQLSTKLAGLKKGTQAYADTARQLKAAQDALTPAQKRFAGALDGVKKAFDKIPKSIILKPITDGMGLLAKIMPLLEPVLKTVSRVLSDLLGQLSDAAASPGFKKFTEAFAKQLGPDLRAFATIAGNVFTGLFGLFGVFNKQLSGGVLKSIENLTARFAHFGRTAGDSKGLKSFVEYVKRVSPDVIQALKDVARAMGKIITALAPLGPPVLHIISGIADALGGIPTPVLTGIAAAMASIVAVQKLGGFKAIALLSKGLGGISGVGAKSLGGGLLKRGVVPVFVTNEGFGGGGGVGGGKSPIGKLFSPITSAASGFLAASGLSAAAAAGWASAGAAIGFAAVKGYQLSHTNALLNGPLGFNTLVDKIGSGAFHIGPKPVTTGFLGPRDLGLPQIRSVGTAVDALRTNLGKASTNIDQIGPHARNSFGTASHEVDVFSAKLALIHDKKLAILVNDLAAARRLEALQAFRFKDKSINITTNLIERVVGPGGGIGQPSPNNANGVPNPTSRTTTPDSSRGGDTYNIQAQDYNAFLRQLQSRRRGKAGGGVNLTPAGAR